MGNKATFTLLGAYYYDNNLFDGLKLPDKIFSEGYENLFQELIPMDKDVFIHNLLMECGQLSLVYADPEFLKAEISYWSAMHQIDWRQMYETIFYKYNPIWNKDGIINETESGNVTGRSGNTRTLNTSKTEQHSGKDEYSKGGSDDSTTTSYVNAYDSGTGTEHDKTVLDDDWTESGDTTHGEKIVTTETGTVADSATKSEESGRNNSRTETGNIGVTMSQQMIEAQRNVIFNMYSYIIGQFKERFCLLVW